MEKVQAERIDLGVCPAELYRGDVKRAAVLLPGQRYGASMPLLWFTRELLQARGFTVLAVEAAKGDWPLGVADAALTHLEDADQVLVVAKSASSRAAPLVTRRGLAAVWLTPLLNDLAVVDAIAATRAPALVIGGTADSAWDQQAALRLRAKGHDVIEVPGADHSLQFPDNTFASVAALNRYLEALDLFVASLAALGELAGSRSL